MIFFDPASNSQEYYVRKKNEDDSLSFAEMDIG
jgi:hypothetical protein